MRHFFTRPRVSRALIALFFLSVLALGLATVNDYGTAWDEPSEMNILRMTAMEYAKLLPFFEQGKATLDEMGVIPISQSVERDHGICLYYPLIGLVCNPTLNANTVSLVWRCYTWALFTIGLFSLYAVARRLGISRVFACLAVLFVLLSPRFFAEGHYNNKDIALFSAVLVLLLQSARMMENPSFSRALGFGLAAGVCVGTRIVGAVYCLLFGMALLAHLISTRCLNRRAVWAIDVSFLCAVGCYALLTPSFPADPAGFLAYLLKNAVGFSRWNGELLFFGRVLSPGSEKLPWLYLPVTVAVTTPLWALALALCGLFFQSGRTLRCLKNRCLFLAPESLLRVITLVGWLLPFCALILLRPVLYNGWRHVYFLYGPMALGMADALHALWQHLAARKVSRRILACVLSLCLLISAAGIVANHPYQYGYFNPLVPRFELAQQFDLDWWNLSCANALEKLLAQTDGDIVIGASDRKSYSGLFTANQKLRDSRVHVVRFGASDIQPDFILSNLSYAAMAEFHPPEGMEPTVVLSAYGAPMTVIYQRTDTAQP